VVSRRSGNLLVCCLLLLPCPVLGGSGEYRWNLPRGFPVPHVPSDNPMSDAKVALGRKLFFEPRLSVTGRHSCASCHAPERAFADSRPLSIGATGDTTRTNAMSLTNVAYNVSFGWDRAEVRSLEEQMLEPMLSEHPVELGLKGREAAVVASLSTDESYRKAFADAFPRDDGSITFERVVQSIAAYERTLISGRSPFDLYVFEGQHGALTPDARNGMALFFSERLGCASCHSGFNFSGAWRDAQGATGEPTFANNGIGSRPMRVPTLRNVSLTAPYMHDGRLSTLEAVVDHYERTRSPALRAFTLTPVERRELIAFLHSLTDPTFTAESHVERPHSACSGSRETGSRDRGTSVRDGWAKE
jgi:cytochrome c peroxidase